LVEKYETPIRFKNQKEKNRLQGLLPERSREKGGALKSMLKERRKQSGQPNGPKTTTSKKGFLSTRKEKDRFQRRKLYKKRNLFVWVQRKITGGCKGEDCQRDIPKRAIGRVFSKKNLLKTGKFRKEINDQRVRTVRGTKSKRGS